MNDSNRRHFLKTSASLAALAAMPRMASAADAAPAAAGFTLSPLPYAVEALEPHIDAQTMGIHHGKHHAGYVTNLNAAVAKAPGLAGKSLHQIIARLSDAPEEVRTALRNHGGGTANHDLFWATMAPGAGGVPQGTLAEAVGKTFGSFEAFQTAFSDAAMKRFGSGWAWLVVRGDKSLGIVSTANQDSPLMKGIVEEAAEGTPILGLDVWEHAYYLKYQNRRADYIKAWWNVVNWAKVADLHEKA